jgi:IS30 family transposase
MWEVIIKQVFNAVDKFNSRPRKYLNFKTPYEVFKELNWN